MEELDFSFDSGDASPSVTRTVTLQNRWTHPAKFSFALPESLKGKPAYTVSLPSGEVLPPGVVDAPKVKTHPT